MTSNTNNKTDPSEILYKVFLYKKKDITAIQKKLGINSNINQTTVSESKKAKKLADSYELLLELVGDLIPIQEKLGIDINPILEAELKRDRASSDKPIRLFDLLLCLEDDIATIQEKIGIVGYTNREIAEEADKNARVYLRKFEKFHGPLEDVPSVLIQKFIDSGVKKFWFTGEGLPLFPNVSPQQLHEIFVKKLANIDQCPCLESEYLDKTKPQIPDSSDGNIPRDYEKTSEFRYVKKLVKTLNKSKFLDYFDKCRECNKLFHDPDLGSYCKKHILNKRGCCKNHCCIDEEAGHCILHCIKKN
ncbi:11619_t:CDS:2 [Entrophospora sp. SA101]|nr:11619_t:CDS:2 [Entrophospora sp. SA101]